MAEKKHSVHFDITAQDKASAALAAVEKNLTGVVMAAVSIGGIGASFTAFMADAIKTRSALDDLADTTGDNVRTLDALRRQAVISGVEFEQMGGSITKFARNLNAADDEGKAAAQAIEAIGLKVGDLRAMKPADAMIEVAKALGQFEDGAGKVAVAVALMGKEGAKMLPFMKDLAEAGELNGRITAEQAAQAERTEKEWRKLTQAFKDGKDALANTLIPVMGDYLEQLREGLRILGGWPGALARIPSGLAQLGSVNPLKTTGENLAAIRVEMEKAQKAQDAYGARGDAGLAAGLNGRIASLREAKAFFELQQRQDALKLTGPQYQDARDIRAGMKPKLDFVPTGPDKKGEKKADDSERIARLIVEAEEQAAKDTADAWKFYTDQQIKEQKVAADAQAAMWKQVFESIDKEQEDAIEAGRVLLDALAADAKRSAEEARALGMVFSSAFEDAVVGGKDLRSVLQGLAQDVARIFIRKSMTEPMAAGLADLLKPVTGGLSGFMSGLFKGGGGSSSGDFGASVAGLPSFDVGTDFVPRDMIARVHKGERIVPADENRAGGGITINQTMHFGSNVDRATLIAWGRQVKQETIAAVADSRMRGGSYASAMRG